MEASSSTHPPETPTHPSLLPSLSPAFEQTPSMLHALPPHLYTQTPTHPHSHTPLHGAMQPPPPRPAFFPQNTPGNVPSDGNVFGSVMGGSGSAVVAGRRGTVQASPSGSVHGAGTVYASVYSGIPVYEAMIRGISVMRRTSDSWVNATQILKVAGIPKSQRTKILEKDIIRGEHEKVQGGYGKYQGTWIPFTRGQELAEQYGCSEYLSPIFDFLPHGASAPTALPLTRPHHPEALAPGSGASYQVYQSHESANQGQPFPGPPNTAYLPYPPGQYHPSHAPPGLAPAHAIEGMGLPQSRADVYIDQYGQPHPTYQAQMAPQHYTSNVEPTYPVKRQRSDEVYSNGHDEPNDVEPIEVDEEDAESSDEIPDAPPLPTAMRLANKPLRPKRNALAARIRSKLLGIFASTSPEVIDLRSELGVDPDSDAPLEFDIDMVIDSQGHTALHWACSLAQTEVTTQLLDLGADIHRGNYAGETPLMRAVLTTNHAESGTFPQLLELVSPSIRTLDQAYRSVLHHIALVAGLKGRASSARAYMAGTLEWVARGNVGNVGIKNLVDVQDVHGDTALNVAARVGNRGLVKLLLDAGADKSRANKLGLKPVDHGVEVEALTVQPGEAVVSSLKSEVAKPERQSKDVQKNIAAIFETITDTFAAEMTAKQTAFNTAEQSVRSATRILAERRMQIQRAQSALNELEQTRQKLETVRGAMPLVGRQDWTGRTRVVGEKIQHPAFRPVGGASRRGESRGEAVLPSRDEVGGLEKMRRMALWEDRIGRVLDDRTRALEGDSAERAVKYRRLVSLCTKVPVEKVDSMLGELTSAIESDGQGLDLSRVSQFMQRMKESQGSKGSGNGAGNGNGEQ